ncbi:helix-turn-helix domain-containing protein [Streptomyces sp. NPDC052676]|uniref:helix-turn-helix domain-containing protein n=1 Tax=Streptomyces sp. NPDC052676 TaxID=3154953 RepID=UPI00342D1726
MKAWDAVPGALEHTGGRVSGHDDDVAGFAKLLRELKERTDRSYGALARRLNMNTSTLHRYCAGDAVPQDFAPVERFAALCGATPEERLELHRRWLAALAARRRPRTAPDASPVAAEPDETGDTGDTGLPGLPGKTGETGETGERQEPGVPGDHAAPAPPQPPAPWYRRRRLVVSAAVACAFLATVGSLAALPTDRRASAEAAPPSRTTATAPAPGTPDGSSTPTRSPSPGRPSPTASPTAPGKKDDKPRPSPTNPAGRTAPAPSPTTPAIPLTWTVDSHVWAQGCGHDYVIGKPPAQVPPPPAPQDAKAWAATQHAVHGEETNVRISVQGLSDTAVVLEALRVRVVGRAEPAAGNAYAMDQGCGGALTPRHFAVDLDKDRPIARSVAGSDAGTPIPAVRLPYRVSAEDPEVLLVTARTEGCDCRWWLELDWSSQGRTGTVRVDDHGRPFRTSALSGLPRYTYDTSARAWAPYR